MMLRTEWVSLAALLAVIASGCCAGGRWNGGSCCNAGGRYYDGCLDGVCGEAPCDPCGRRGGGLGGRFLTCHMGCGDAYWGELASPRCDSCDLDGHFIGRSCRSPLAPLADFFSFIFNPCCGGGHCGDCCGHGSGCGMEVAHPTGGGGCASCGHAGTARAHGMSLSQGVTSSRGPSHAASRTVATAARLPAPPSQHRGAVSVAKQLPHNVPTTGRYPQQQVSYQQPAPRPAPRTTTGATGISLAPTGVPTAAPVVGYSGSRVPSTAADFDLPPGARIIKIEDGE